MPQIPDLWGRVLSFALGMVGTLLTAWAIGRWDERRAARDAESGAAWRRRVEERLDLLTECSHVQIRHELIHDAEKMIARGYVTHADRQSWWDSYNAYERLGENGYIADYWLRIQALEIREV